MQARCVRIRSFAYAIVGVTPPVHVNRRFEQVARSPRHSILPATNAYCARRCLPELCNFQRSNAMPLINVKLIDGVFSQTQKQQMITKLTDAMVTIEGE